MIRSYFFLVPLFLLVSCGNSIDKKVDADIRNDADTADGDELLTDADTAAAPVIGAVTVTANEKAPLTCTVRWQTDIAASSLVEFGEGKYEFVIGDETPVKDHKVIVIGMYAGKLYSLRAVSETNGLRAESAEESFLTPALPEQVVAATVKMHEEGKTFDGWTAVLLASGQFDEGTWALKGDPDFPFTGVIYDMAGEPVWYYDFPFPTTGDAQYYEKDGTIVFTTLSLYFPDPTPAAIQVDMAGETVWEGPAQPVNVLVDQLYHHTFLHMSNGNWLTILEDLNSEKILGDTVLEMDKDYETLWSWNTFDHLTPDTTGWDPEAVPIFDWTHVNAVDIDEEADTVYANARNLDAVYRIDRKTGDIVWTLGAKGDFTFTGQNDTPWFLKSHGMHHLDNGNIIMFDNGETAGGRPWSRGVEYKLNETAKTAEIVWEYRGEEPFFAAYWGDADRLPNGNTLVSAGHWLPTGMSHLFEADAAGNTVWALEFPHHGDYTIGFYNACRFVPPVKKIVP